MTVLEDSWRVLTDLVVAIPSAVLITGPIVGPVIWFMHVGWPIAAITYALFVGPLWLVCVGRWLR